MLGLEDLLSLQHRYNLEPKPVPFTTQLKFEKKLRTMYVDTAEAASIVGEEKLVRTATNSVVPVLQYVRECLQNNQGAGVHLTAHSIARATVGVSSAHCCRGHGSSSQHSVGVVRNGANFAGCHMRCAHLCGLACGAWRGLLCQLGRSMCAGTAELKEPSKVGDVGHQCRHRWLCGYRSSVDCAEHVN